MKIYRLDVLEVQREARFGAIVSSYVAPRTLQKSEFYATQDKAESRRAEINNGLNALVGVSPVYEVTVTPVEVIE